MHQSQYASSPYCSILRDLNCKVDTLFLIDYEKALVRKLFTVILEMYV